jgi:hypothetical protein
MYGVGPRHIAIIVLLALAVVLLWFLFVNQKAL